MNERQFKENFEAEFPARIYVVSGTISEFHRMYDQKNRQQKGPEYIFVTGRETFMGLRKPKVIVMGTYYLRRDWLKLKKEFLHIEANVEVDES